MQEENSIHDKIQQLQEQYYNKNKKNSFFKSSQKLDCAKHITEQIPLNDLLPKTFVLKENTNIVITDYLVFKTYANPNNYKQIVDYVVNLLNHCIQKHGCYQLHVYLESFTITAAQRHSPLIKMFCQTCFTKESELSRYLEKMYIYKYPSVIHTIKKLFTPFIDKDSLGKVELVGEKV